MLVLKRKLDESIMIGDGIEVKVLDIKGEHVKLGITAPLSISVHRKEVYLAIQAENRASTDISDINIAHINKIMKEQKK